jgi:hypothetical protein
VVQRLLEGYILSGKVKDFFFVGEEKKKQKNICSQRKARRCCEERLVYGKAKSDNQLSWY